MKHDSEARTVRLYELLLLTLAALCVGLGVYSHAVTPAVPDALGVRIGLAVVSLVGAGTLFVAPFLWRLAGPITYSVLTLHTVLHLFFLYVSQLAPAQTIGMLMVMVLTAISLHDIRWMLGYSLSAGGVAVGLAFSLETTSIQPILLLTGVLAVPAVGFIAVQSRRILEEELLDTIAESQVAVKTKSEFLATMSHEIRTPMNGVLGMATLLGDTNLTDTQRDYVETIRLSGDTLLTIINDILDFSKIEADRIELEEAPFDLRAMVEEALDLLASKAYEKPVDLVYHIDEEVPMALLGDVTRLRQIVVNLVGNAIKFTDDGEVLLTVKKRRAVGGEQELVFAVRDTGIGIPPDRIDRLFASFSQVDSSHTRKYGGTGLGLAISKRLAELMGGTMWVESEVGVGSTFSFTVLARTSASVTRAALKGKQAALAAKRLLVVEDGAYCRKALAKQLRTWGAVVTAAPSARDAIRLLREGGQFDAAVLDMQLADMEGAALAAKLHESSALPLVGLTAPGRPVQTEGFFVAALSKPVKQVPLYNGLLTALGPAVVSTDTPLISDEGIWIQRDQQPASADTIQQVLAGTPGASPILPDLRILLAEDNAVNQKVALRILERLGYDADLATNGREAVEAFETQSYDVILMDVQMPEMDGLQATQFLRATLPRERQPRIIAMTANAMEGDREHCLAAGMDDYLPKPVKREALTQALLECEPLGTLKLDASPLGAATSVPIRSAPTLELPAFARPDAPAASEAIPTANGDAPSPTHAETTGAEPLQAAGEHAVPTLDLTRIAPSGVEEASEIGHDEPPSAPVSPDIPTAAVPSALPPPAESATEGLAPADPMAEQPMSELAMSDEPFVVTNPFRVARPQPATPPADVPESTDVPASADEPAPADFTAKQAPVDEPVPFDPDTLFPMPEAPSLPAPMLPAASPPVPEEHRAPAAPSLRRWSTPRIEEPRPPASVPPPFENAPPSAEPPAADPPPAPVFGAAFVEPDVPDFGTPDSLTPDSLTPDSTTPDPLVPDPLVPDDAFFDVSDLLSDPGFSFPAFDDAPPLSKPSATPPARSSQPSAPEPAPPADLITQAVAEEALAVPTPDEVMQHLRDISGLDDPEFAREVLDGYLRADLGLIGTVVEGMRTRSYAEVTAAAHKLKSSAATLGAVAFSKVCGQVEAESRQQRFTGDIAARIASFRAHGFAFRNVVQEAHDSV
ncbi:MAG: response regulator [Bacteroidota bacterium]